MKVKVGDKVFDAEKEPVMVILSEEDKENIRSMDPGATRYCDYPDGTPVSVVEEFMGSSGDRKSLPGGGDPCGGIGTAPDDSILCECEIRGRAWDPNTGKCLTCGCRFEIWVNADWWAKATAAAKVEGSSGGDPLCGGDNAERTCRIGHKYITNVDEPGLCWCGERAELVGHDGGMPDESSLCECGYTSEALRSMGMKACPCGKTIP